MVRELWLLSPDKVTASGKVPKSKHIPWQTDLIKEVLERTAKNSNEEQSGLRLNEASSSIVSLHGHSLIWEVKC